MRVKRSLLAFMLLISFPAQYVCFNNGSVCWKTRPNSHETQWARLSLCSFRKYILSKILLLKHPIFYKNAFTITHNSCQCIVIVSIINGGSKAGHALGSCAEVIWNQLYLPSISSVDHANNCSINPSVDRMMKELMMRGLYCTLSYIWQDKIF